MFTHRDIKRGQYVQIPTDNLIIQHANSTAAVAEGEAVMLDDIHDAFDLDAYRFALASRNEARRELECRGLEVSYAADASRYSETLVSIVRVPS